MGQQLHLTNARFTRDPEIDETPTGMKVAKFSVATDGWDSKAKQKVPEFWDCKAFDKTAQTIESYCGKGRSVNIIGKIHKETWDDRQTGEKRSKWVVTVDPFGLELGPQPKNHDDELEDVPGFDAKPTNLFGS